MKNLASIISRTINDAGMVQASILNSSEEEYDVFINFRGEDTRRNIVDHLYFSLKEAQIKVFLDNPSIPFGEEIERKLLAAIERSRIAITIISEDYASSDACLKELAHIMRCKKTRNLTVIPIFYRVKPSDIRSLGNSFQRIQLHVINYHGTIVERWKDALKGIANMKGVIVDGMSFEGEIVRSIVDKVKIELKNPRNMGFNETPKRKTDTDHLVGIPEKAREIMEVISDNTDGVQIVGIYGMGGIGKTTLAKYIYRELKPSFEFCSFVPNVRETFSGDVSVDQLLPIILEQRRNRSNKGMDRIKQLLHDKKVLIVLDDIDSRIKMRTLMQNRDFIGSGSKIILTTRNIHVFSAPEVTLKFKLSRLSNDEAQELFYKHAFGGLNALNTMEAYSNKVVEFCDGVPLALQVIGSYLFGKEEAEWEHISEILEDGSSKSVENILLLAYQTLDDKQKQTFLDMASFPNGFDKNNLFSVLEDADIEALDKLEALSFISFNNDDKLHIHDLLRDLAKKILQVEGSAESAYHSQSWMDESKRMQEGSKKAYESTPSFDEAVVTPTTQLDEQDYLPEAQGCTLQTEKIQTTAIVKGKAPMVALEKTWLSQYESGESSNVRKLQRGSLEVPGHFDERNGNTSIIGYKYMEAKSPLCHSIAHLDRLFGEINSGLACPRYTVEEKIPHSTQEAISLVDSLIKQINLPNVADIDFASPKFLQVLEILRQPNALHEVPAELLMPFHKALTSFAETPKHLDQIQFAKNTLDNCIQVHEAKVDETKCLKLEVDKDKDALEKTEREIVLLEDKLKSLKERKDHLVTKLTNAAPIVTSLHDELERCRDSQLEAQALFDKMPTSEENIKANHFQVLYLLHKMKDLLRSKARK